MTITPWLKSYYSSNSNFQNLVLKLDNWLPLVDATWFQWIVFCLQFGNLETFMGRMSLKSKLFYLIINEWQLLSYVAVKTFFFNFVWFIKYFDFLFKYIHLLKSQLTYWISCENERFSAIVIQWHHNERRILLKYLVYQLE